MLCSISSSVRAASGGSPRGRWATCPKVSATATGARASRAFPRHSRCTTIRISRFRLPCGRPWQVPSLPTSSLLGSDILRTNPNLVAADGLVHVQAVRPDIAIVHVQRADEHGRAHAWGPLGITEEAGLAADGVIVSCEDLVASSVTLSDPNRILFPETKVVAVVHEPGGAHPSPVQGHFKRDHAFYRDYAEQ